MPPVGSYQDLLPYLIRRLLENGANSSFVNQMNDSSITLDQLVEDPLEKARSFEYMPHPNIVLPKIYLVLKELTLQVSILQILSH